MMFEGVGMLYWHWMLLGIALAMAEIFLASFTVLWFGIGALLIGALLLLFPAISMEIQLLAWIVLSGGLAIFWFRYFRPRMIDKTNAGIAREALLGETGIVIKAPKNGVKGVVRFSTPILGSDEWDFICEDAIANGDRVSIREFSGNSLIVTKE